MFSEILKIIPRIDRAALGVMESTLTKRFVRVAGRFGKGLEKVMKGNLLFLSLGFVAQLLNPLEKVHDKIKDLLSQGFDLDELADKFNTTPGTIKRLQSVGQALGLEPQRLGELMNKFAEAIDKAREELSDPTKERSKATQAVSQFVDEQDLGRGFFQFIQSLRAQGQQVNTVEVDRRTGEIVRPENRARLRQQGLTETLSGADIRTTIEKEIFGEVQHGAARRFIESDLVDALSKLGLRGSDIDNPGQPQWMKNDGDVIDIGVPNELDQALQNVIDLSKQQKLVSTVLELKDFIKTSGMVNQNMVMGMEAAAERERKADARQLANAEMLQKASKNLDELTKVLTDVSTKVLEGIGFLSGYIPEALKTLRGLQESMIKFTDARVFRMFQSK